MKVNYIKEILRGEYKIIWFLYVSYFILKPFYFWSSGLPQISDLILVFLVLSFIWFKRSYSFQLTNKKILLFGSAFVLYATIVNLTWSIILSTTEMFIPSIFLIYNYIIFLIVYLMNSIYKEKVLKTTFYASLISIILQFLFFLFSGGFSGTRNTGSFNNPNQLGYYALLTAGFIIFITTNLRLKFKWSMLGLFLGLILVFTSLSKAAILSYIGLIVVYFLTLLSDKNENRKMIIVLLMLLISSILLNSTTNFFEENQLLMSVEMRLDSVGDDSDDSLTGRGYDRITNYPEHWLFGAGEGEYKRFRGLIEGSEFHSTLGNIQVSYGVIGLFLFLMFISSVVNINIKSSWYIILFILMYGLTHNGIRNTLFWILLALIGSSKPRKSN